MPTALSPDFLRRIIYSKYLLERAQLLASEGHDLALAAAVLTAHDAVEMAMRVVTDPLNVKPDYKFPEFWRIVKKQSQKDAPLEAAMARLNHVRNGFKHKGIAPNPDTARECITNASTFCEEVSKQFLDTDYREISLADLIQHNATRKYVKDAESARGSGDLKNAMGLLGLAFDELMHDARTQHGSTLIGRIVTSHWKIPAELRFQFGEELRKINRMAEVIDALVLGINVTKFTHFSDVTPIRTYFGDGHCEMTWHPSTPSTGDDYTFCHRFVIDCALRLLAH